jgi:hypothetical protein
LGLKITSPTTGQQVPIGNSLIASGTSSHNAVSNCEVSVIANGIKPYQPALASGPGGAKDFSKWSFTLSPKYTAIKEGENKITAKLSCPTNPTNLTKWSSVNFVGVANDQQHALLSSSSVASTPTKATTSTTLGTTAPVSTATNTPDSGKLLYLGVNSKSANKDDNAKSTVARLSSSVADKPSKKTTTITNNIEHYSINPSTSKTKANPMQNNNNNGLSDNMNNFAQHLVENVKRKIKSDGINVDIPLPIPFG